MEKNTKNNAVNFDIKYRFFDNTRETELEMFINGKNILAFERNGKMYTTRWNLDDIAFWLREFLNNMDESPFPFDVKGEYAAIKDMYAHEFDSEDLIIFDAYYDKLDEWNLKHRWHSACSGEIISDVYFQFVQDNVEISWNNTDCEEGVTFLNKIGGIKIPKNVFISKVENFLNDYAKHWF